MDDRTKVCGIKRRLTVANYHGAYDRRPSCLVYIGTFTGTFGMGQIVHRANTQLCYCPRHALVV